jgi:hypothetical protein
MASVSQVQEVLTVRSSSIPSCLTPLVPDGMHPSIFHGHGMASADDPKDYISHYFQQVDAGLRDLLRDEQALLVLAGVDYLLPIYAVLDFTPGLISVDLLPPSELQVPLPTGALTRLPWIRPFQNLYFR